MSYVFIGIIVFLGLGGMVAAMDNQPVKRFAPKSGNVRIIYSGVLVVTSLVMIFTSIRYIQANNAVVKARELMAISTDFQEIKAPLDQALDKRSDQPDGVLNMNALLQAAYEQLHDESLLTADYNILSSALKKEPYNKNLYNQLIIIYQLKGENDQAYEVLKDNADRYAWDMAWYEKLIAQSFELGYQSLSEQDAEKKEYYFKAGMDAYQHVVDGVEHLKTLPEGQLQGNPFYITPLMTLNAGKIQFMLNNPAEAADILKQGITEDLTEATNQEIIRWYLAALQKTGTNDQPLYDQYIQIDPTGKDAIDQLAQMTF